MSLFTVGKRYQGDYYVEKVVDFFDGELAISNFLDERYYLQSVPLVRDFTTLEFHRFKKLYNELDLDLLLPVSEMFLEGNQLVFVYPYEPIHPIRDIVMSTDVSDDEIFGWFHKIVETEIALQSMGIPMYLIRDPRNIGLNENRELRVIFTAIEDVILTDSPLNWGTFFYCVASGDYLDESLNRMPTKHSLSRPVARVIQKSFRAKNLQDLYAIVNQAMKRRKGGGLIESLFGKKKKEPVSNEAQPNSEPLTIETASQPSQQPEQQSQVIEFHRNRSEETVDWSQPNDQPKEQKDPESSPSTQLHGAVHEPDPFHQQLEEMYQAMEQQESQANQQTVANQQAIDETKIFHKQDQQHDVTNQQPFDNLQIDHQQLSNPNEAQSVEAQSDLIHSSSVETPLKMEPSQDPVSEPKEPEPAKQEFQRKSSQDSFTNDQTQIFSASDLSSIEAELKEMERNIEAEKRQEAEKGLHDEQDQKPEQLEQTVVQPASDDLGQLEKLFSEMDQLQGEQQAEKTNQPPQEQTQQEETAQSEFQDESISQLDQKMKEIESLFAELNQGQLQTNLSSAATAEATESVQKTEPKEAAPKNKREETAKRSSKKKKKEKPKANKKENRPEKKEDKSVKKENQSTAIQEAPKEEDPLEKLRIEFEQEQRRLLERQQKRLKERQQALIKEAEEELKRRQEELLQQFEQEEEKLLWELEEKFHKRRLKEMRRIELKTLKRKHDQDVTNGLEKIRKDYEEREKQKLEELDQEYQRRKQEIMDQLKEQRLNEEKEFKAQKAKEWEKLLKKMNEEETDDDGAKSRSSESKQEGQVEKDPSTSKEEESKRKKTKNSKKGKQVKKQDATKEEKKNNDEIASQFDEYKKELYSEDQLKESEALSENSDVGQQV